MSKRGLHILLAIHHFPPDRVAGAELYAYRVARWMLGQGYRVQVMCVSAIDKEGQNGSVDFADEVYDEIPIRRFSFKRGKAPASLEWSFEHPLLYAHLLEWLRSYQPDLVHLVSGYLMGIAPLRAARELGIPTVVSLTDFWFLCPTLQLLRGDGSLCEGPDPLECARCLYDEQRRYRWIDQRAPSLMQTFWRTSKRVPSLSRSLGLTERLVILERRRAKLMEMLNNADVIAPITHFLADMHVRNGIDASRCEITPYSVGIAKPKTPHVSSGEVHFAYLGQIAPIKGLEILIRAFRHLRLNRRPARLTIHGSLKLFPDYVRKLLALTGNEGTVSFEGEYKHEDLPVVLSGVDAVVIPSLWYENSPHVALEAFATKIPVIATNVGGISEIVTTELNGLLFKRGSVRDLARQMQRVIDEPGLLARLAQEIRPSRTLEQEMTQLMAIYHRVVTDNRNDELVPTQNAQSL